MCGKGGIGKTLLSVGAPLIGAVGGDLLGPEIGLSPGLGGAIGGGLGGLLGGLGAGDKPLGLIENAAFGSLGGFGLGEALGPGLGGIVGAPPTAVSGAGAGGGAAGISGGGGHADAIGGAGSDQIATGQTDSSGGIMDLIKKNPQLALAGGGLLLSALQGQGQVPGEKGLKASAAEAAKLGGLSDTLLTGKLPPGAANLVTNALNDTISGIKSKYASLGLSGSTMEAQDIAAAQERASAETFNIAQQLTTTGLDAAGLAAQIYSQIANIQLAQDQELTQALGGFALSGGYNQGMKSLTG